MFSNFETSKRGFTLIELMVTIFSVAIVVISTAILLIQNQKTSNDIQTSVNNDIVTTLNQEAIIGINFDMSYLQYLHIPMSSACPNASLPCLRQLNTNTGKFYNYNAGDICPPPPLASSTPCVGMENLDFFTKLGGDQIHTNISEEYIVQSVPNPAATLSTVLIEKPDYSSVGIARNISSSEQPYYSTHPLCDQINTSTCQYSIPFYIFSQSSVPVSFSFHNFLDTSNGLLCDSNKRPFTNTISNTSQLLNLYNNLNLNGYAFYQASKVLTTDEMNQIKGRLMLVYDPTKSQNYIIQYISDIIKCDTSSGSPCVSQINQLSSVAGISPALNSSLVSGDYLIKLRSLESGISDLGVSQKFVPNYIPDFASTGVHISYWDNTYQPTNFMFPTMVTPLYRTLSSNPTQRTDYVVTGTSMDDANLVHRFVMNNICSIGSETTMTAVPINIKAFYLRDPAQPNLSCNASGVKCGLYTSTFNGTSGVMVGTKLGDEETKLIDTNGPLVFAKSYMGDDAFQIFKYNGSYSISTYSEAVVFQSSMNQ